MDVCRIRHSTTLPIEEMTRYALQAATDIQDEEIRQIILAKAGYSLIYDDGDTFDLKYYLLSLAFAEECQKSR